MSPAIITIIILVIGVIALLTNKVPMHWIGIFFSASVVIFGILPIKNVLMQFIGDTILMVFGILVLGQCIFEVGLADAIGNAIANWSKTVKNGNIMVAIVMALACAGMSTVLSNLGVAAAFVPLALTIARGTKISRTKIMMLLAMASGFGGMCVQTGSPPNLFANAALEQAGYPSLGFAGFAWVGVPMTIIGILYICFIGMKFVPDRVDENNPGDADGADNAAKDISKTPKWKIYLTVGLYIILILDIIFAKKTGVPAGYVGVACCVIIFATGILGRGKKFVKALNPWLTLFVVGMLNIAAALTRSGAGKMMAEGCITLLGGNTNPIVVLGFFYIVSAVLTQALNNTGLSGIMYPLGLSMAVQAGIDPRAMILTLCMGCSASYATPIGTPANAIVSGPGKLTFRDWLVVGTPIVIILGILCVVICPLVYSGL